LRTVPPQTRDDPCEDAAVRAAQAAPAKRGRQVSTPLPLGSQLKAGALWTTSRVAFKRTDAEALAVAAAGAQCDEEGVREDDEGGGKRLGLKSGPVDKHGAPQGAPLLTETSSPLLAFVSRMK
jgi:hypothetical protein